MRQKRRLSFGAAALEFMVVMVGDTPERICKMNMFEK